MSHNMTQAGIYGRVGKGGSLWLAGIVVPDGSYRLNGKGIGWYEDGTKALDCTLYQDKNSGERAEGRCQRWYKNGNQQEDCVYKNGKHCGPCSSWFESGVKQGEASMDSLCREHGLSISWFPNGQKSSECNYQHGFHSGKCTKWVESGQKISECVYQYDESGRDPGQCATWSEDGKRISEGGYLRGKACGTWKCWKDEAPIGCRDIGIVEDCKGTPTGAECPVC